MSEQLCLKFTLTKVVVFAESVQPSAGFSQFFRVLYFGIAIIFSIAINFGGEPLGLLVQAFLEALQAAQRSVSVSFTFMQVEQRWFQVLPGRPPPGCKQDSLGWDSGPGSPH